MQARQQRYVRRDRGFEREINEGPGGLANRDVRDEDPEAPRGRRRRTHFGEHLEATREIVGWTAADEAQIDASRHLIAARLDGIEEELRHELLSFPEMAAQFRSADGTIDGELLSARSSAIHEWLRCIVDDPLEASTAGYLASIALTLVRLRGRGSRMKARHTVRTLSRLQSMFIEALANGEGVSDGRYASAWCKRLIIHVDLFLAVYGATESGPHWY